MDAETRARLLGLFVAEAEESFGQLERLAEPLREGDGTLAEFGQVTHGLKGAASAVGQTEFASLLHLLEELGLRLGGSVGHERTKLHARLSRALSRFQALTAALGATGKELPRGELDALASLLRSSAAGPLPPAAPSQDAGEPQSAARPPAGEEEAPRASADAPVDRLTVPAADVDETLRLASAMARMATALQEELSRREGGQLGAAAQDLSVTSERLETLLFNLRMIPAAEAFAGLDAEVRQLSARLGKEAQLLVDTEGVRADRRTLQTARGMVRHLVRNALDHGLEAPLEREQAGKPRRGLLRITVSMSESQLWVRVTDDGRGFDLPAIRARLSADPGRAAKIAALSDAEVIQEFAIQGGSTREDATDVSGRGMGVSAVVSLARSRGGDFQIFSAFGRGSTFAFFLPLEVYATEVLTVTCGARTLGIPVSSVERTVCIGAEGSEGGLQQTPTGLLLAIDERIIQFHPLARSLSGEGEESALGRFAVVVKAEQREVAFGVDELGETLRVVPRTLPPAVHAEALVTGVALLPDQRRLQILNPRKLVAGMRAVVAETPRAKPAPKKREGKLKVLLAEDSLATREVLRVLLEQQGFDVRVAGDGEEAQGRIAEALPDLVVSDLNMPRCDGLALTRALRMGPRTARLPVILLTSQDEAAMRDAGKAAGADAYLIKSKFNATVLHETLRRIGLEE